MSRPAEELLEFDKLKDIVSCFATCAPGRRSIVALTPRQDAALLDAEFGLVQEAMDYLRGGSELGFGSLADPDMWLPCLAVPASVLAGATLLDAASLMDTAFAVRQTFKGEAPKHPRLAERAAALADLRHLSAAIRRAVTAERRNQRRRFSATEAHPHRQWARRAKEFSVRSKASCAPAASRPAKITSRCATTAS